MPKPIDHDAAEERIAPVGKPTSQFEPAFALGSVGVQTVTRIQLLQHFQARRRDFRAHSGRIPSLHQVGRLRRLAKVADPSLRQSLDRIELALEFPSPLIEFP